MSRPPRISIPGATYHVLNRFVDKHPFFHDDEDFHNFIETYFEVAACRGIKTYSYCVMSNHFHLVIEMPDDRLSDFLQRLLTRVACRLNRCRDREGHLFQGRTKTLLVENELYFETVNAYVLLNPVRAGICVDPFAYSWSSASEMLRGSPRLALSTLASRLDGTKEISNPDQQCARLVHWLRAAAIKENEQRFLEGRRGQFLSTALFRKSRLDLAERRMTFLPVRARRATDRPREEWTWAAIGEMAERTLERTGAAAWSSIEEAAEHLKICIAHCIAGWRYDRIQREDGDRHPLGRFSMIVSRARRRQERWEAVRELLERCQTATLQLS